MLQSMYHKGIEAYVRLLHEIGEFNGPKTNTDEDTVVKDEL